ncbi:acyl-CoA thioesterase/bile acid-CoA:amino acid N-acyltransferase family protein [Streptomyces sp. NPDC047315]|uniref:acyl-CoA thioesterase/bile acid-CoA:amino acid N-acyltransferase family protein n=1 Tax=Streptomyces sp. NPDC047315 TaxID=3155142 RepID=UPI00340DCCA6
MTTGRTRTAAATAVGLALLLAVGCSSGGDRNSDRDNSDVQLKVDKREALADEPVRIQVTGLDAGQKVEVTSQATDFDGMRWTGRAEFAADKKGTVDLNRARPSSGTYEKADGMGLFWSMEPAKGKPDDSFFAPRWPVGQSSYEVHLAVETDGEQVASERLIRTWLNEGVTHRTLTAAKDGVVGTLYLPAAGTERRPPVLNLGGSEGGVSDPYSAALWASRGHPVLALCYFGCAERPENLGRIELDYFASAARLLHREAGAPGQRPTVVGTSRGSEAAQLLGQYHPDLVHHVVLFAPSENTNPGFPIGRDPAWTKDGKAIEHTGIPLDRVRGTVLAVGGGKDGLWPAKDSAKRIAEQRGASGQQHRALTYDDAGHSFGMPPYRPTGLRFKHPVHGAAIDMGGTRVANEHARSDSWAQVLQVLRS